MTTSKKQFELAPVPAHAYIFVAAICLLPGVITAALWAFNPAEFAAMPVWALALILGIGPLIVLFSLKGVRNPVVELDAEGLRMRVSFINKHWPRSELNTDQARLVDLQSSKELSPKWKLWGAALPGLSSGLFKLHNGEKAHVYLTDRRKVAYIPTQSGPILLSLERATDFLAALQAK